MRFRLALALAMSLLVGAFVFPEISAAVNLAGANALLGLVASETAIGLSIGLLTRFYFTAMLFAGALIATLLGLSSMSSAIDDGELVPPPTDILSLTAVALFLVTDLHLEVIAALVNSYSVLPATDAFSGELWLRNLTEVASTASLLAVRLAGPILVIVVALNMVLGIAGRMLPMLPMQFLGAPLVLGLGLIVFASTSDVFFENFIVAFGRWLAKG